VPDSLRIEVKDNIRSHTEVLRQLLSTSADHARKYLLLINAGAAVALMAFMGTNEHVRSSTVAWVSLGIFTLGVTACGILTAFDYHNQLGLFSWWLQESDRFFRNELDLQALYDSLNVRSRRGARGPIVAGYLAFICFIGGASISVWTFLGHRPSVLNAEQSYAAQTSCGASARDWFTKAYAHDRVGVDETRDFGAHYNQKLNRCFAVLNETRSSFVSIQLVDVNENNPIGFYVRPLADKGPSRCEVENKRCNSDEEWNALMKPYVKD
jgi:hypothetical protein